MSARGTADIDDAPGRSILDPEIRSSRPDKPEGGSIVDSEDCVPLLVSDLVNHAIPGVAGIVDDVMDLTPAKLCGLLDKDIEVSLVRDIARYSNRTVGRGVVDGFCNGIGLCRVDITDDHFAAFVGEEPCRFCADTLSRASDAGERQSNSRKANMQLTWQSGPPTFPEGS